MTQAQMIQGTTEEVTRQLQKSYAGQKLRVFIEQETEGEDPTIHLPDPLNTIRSREHLIELLHEGSNSGLATPMTDADWDDIRQEVRTRVTRRNGTPSSNA